ncbi:hypothetical protein JCM16814_23790 [Desulfobaculum senezii]
MTTKKDRQTNSITPAQRKQAYAARYRRANRNNVLFHYLLSVFKDDEEHGKATSRETLATLADEFMLDRKEQRGIELLPKNEVRDTITSILKNGHKYYSQNWATRNFGAMDLPEIDWSAMSDSEREKEIRRRQSEGAKFSRQKHAEKSKDAVLRTYNGLAQATGQIPSKKAVARESGVSLPTVRKYWPTTPEPEAVPAEVRVDSPEGVTLSPSMRGENKVSSITAKRLSPKKEKMPSLPLRGVWGTKD